MSSERVIQSFMLAIAIFLTGCSSSPPTRFYTLDPVVSRNPVGTIPHGHIKIGAVHLPAELDRKMMVAQDAPNSLTIDQQDRWAAPLDDLLRGVLTQDLIERLPPDSVVLPDSAAPSGTKVIALDILRFQPEPSGTAVLEGSWTLSGANAEQPGPSRAVALKIPLARSNSAAQAQAMSQLLGDLADRIATALPR